MTIIVINLSINQAEFKVTVLNKLMVTDGWMVMSNGWMVDGDKRTVDADGWLHNSGRIYQSIRPWITLMMSG